MRKETIEYTDYNGVKRVEDFYFHLSKAEMVEYDNSEKGGLTTLLDKIVKEEDNVKIISLWKQFILMCYGEKSADGKRFVKSEELSKAFSETEAYSELFIKLSSDSDYASDFVNSVCASIVEDPDKKSLYSLVNNK